MKLKNVLIALSFVVLSPSYPVSYVNAQETPKIDVVAPITYQPSQSRVIDFLNSTAMSYGVNVNTLLAISKAESDYDANAHNASSTASGILQFTNGTFKYFCIEKYGYADSMSEKDNYTTQALCGARMIKDGYISAWSASRVIWEKSLNES